MHPYIPELKDLYRKGRISRRTFVQHATLLGLSLGAAQTFLVACAQQQAAAPQPTVSQPAQPTKAPATAAPGAPTAAPTAAATRAAASPTVAASAGIKRGGTLKVSARVQRMIDPAQFSWVFPADIIRHVNEYLSFVDEKGIATPYLLEKWEPSADLKTWTLSVRKGISWFNMPTPREFDAEDVAFNIKRWLLKETGSSMGGLMNYLKPTGVEVADKYTVKLHLDTGEVAVPYHFYQYPALILPREFQGDWLKQPWGTGGFTLEEYVVGERVRLKRREGYWRNGADGKTLPYVDEVVTTDLGEEAATTVAAFAANQVDYFMAPTISTVPALEMLPNVNVIKYPSSDTSVFRVRPDKKPFDNEKVRQALRLTQDREQFVKTVLRGLGTPGYDTHSNEAQADFFPLPVPKQDIAKAKALLAEAGYPNGVDMTLYHKPDPQWEGVACQVLKQQAEPAGIRIKLAPVPSAQYWDNWTEYDFGYTQWYHRPLSTMNYQLAYTCGAAWNESHWCDKDFEKLVADSAGTVDLEERKKKNEKVETYLQEHGPIAIPFHLNGLMAVSKRTQGAVGNPIGYSLYYDLWLKG